MMAPKEEDHISNLREDFTEVARVMKEGLDKVATEIQGMRKDLLEPATGKEQLPMSVANQVFDSYKFMVKALIGLLVTVFVWFTGVEPQLPNHARAASQNEKN